MGVFIHVFDVSRRAELSHGSPLKQHARGGPCGMSSWLEKAACLYKARNDVSGAVYFELLDAVKRLDDGTVLALGRVRIKPIGRFGVARIVSGIVEARFIGLADDFDLGVGDGR